MQNYYIVDTNVLIDYPDIIPNGSNLPLDDPTIDLSNAHIVIPTAVVRELSNFKKESTDRGRIARMLLDRFRYIFEELEPDMSKSYKLKNPAKVGSQYFSTMPVSKNFCEKLVFHPSDNDMDGQIILAVLAVNCSLNDPNFDSNLYVAEKQTVACLDNVTLLTNDNGLSIRANVRGIKTSRFGYKQHKIYTGRRDLIVPNKLYENFIYSNHLGISLEEWLQFMPNEDKLKPNEFIIMTPENAEIEYEINSTYFRNIGRFDFYSQRIVPLQYLSDFPLTVKNAGQAIYVESLSDPNITAIIGTGPAGSGKTFIATVFGYEACKSGKYIGVSIVPCHIENDGIGYLPGDINEKMDPNVQPIKNALRNYLIESDKDIRKKMNNFRHFGVAGNTSSKHNTDQQRNSDKQHQKSVKRRLEDQVENIWSNWFSNIPIAYARGRDFSYEFVIYDEFQDQNRSQADTLIKRIGKEGKIVITGDISQIHAAYLNRDNNGLNYARQALIDLPMVAQVNFTEDEIVRHPLVREVAKRQNNKQK